MDIQIFQYKESDLGSIRLILTEYMTFIANEIINPPWKYNLDIEFGVNFTLNNLDKFAEPYGRLMLVEVDGELAGTISLRKIREDAGEIKRMYVKPKFRGKKLGNLMVEKVISISEENGFSKLFLDTSSFMSSAVSLYKKYGFKEIDSYPECIVSKELWDNWIFMMKEL